MPGKTNNDHPAKVLFFSDCGPENGVFPSQVLSFAQGYSRYVETHVLYRRKHLVSPESSNYAITSYRQLPNLCRPVWRFEMRLAKLIKILPGFNLVHCRGPIAAWMTLTALKKLNRSCPRVVFDCRAALVEEQEFARSNGLHFLIKKLRIREFKHIESEAAKHAHIVTAVSPELSGYLENKYSKKADFIFPPIVDENTFKYSEALRQRGREALDLGQKRVFLFVGGTDPWQRIDILRAWWYEEMSHDKRNELLVLTSKVASFQSIFFNQKACSRNNVKILSVPHKEVPLYMSAADFAILFRDDTMTNRVSSPVKLSEYLAMGLPVVTNQRFYEWIDPERVVYLTKAPFDDLARKVFTTQTRVERSRKSAERFGASSVARKLLIECGCSL